MLAAKINEFLAITITITILTKMSKFYIINTIIIQNIHISLIVLRRQYDQYLSGLYERILKKF